MLVDSGDCKMGQMPEFFMDRVAAVIPDAKGVVMFELASACFPGCLLQINRAGFMKPLYVFGDLYRFNVF